MSTLEHLCLLLIFVLHLHSTRGKQICNSMSCGEIDIQFPFGLKGSNQGSAGCSYPRFQLSCDSHSNTILTLPAFGDLVVKSIDYEDQTIKVNDPGGCLPKRFLQNLSFSGSPFMFDTNLQPHFPSLPFQRNRVISTATNFLPQRSRQPHGKLRILIGHCFIKLMVAT